MSKKHLALALKFGVSGALFWYLLRYKVDLGAAKARLIEVEIEMIFLAVGILLVQAAPTHREVGKKKIREARKARKTICNGYPLVASLVH